MELITETIITTGARSDVIKLSREPLREIVPMVQTSVMNTIDMASTMHEKLR